MTPDFSLLNDLQKEIVQLVADGLSNKEIAKALKINRRTMDDYVTKIYKKLKLERKDRKNNRTLLAVCYLRHRRDKLNDTSFLTHQ